MATDRDILPAFAKPNHYEISLFDLELKAPWSYQGTVVIHLDIREATHQVTINVLEIKLHKAQIRLGDQTIEVNSISEDEKAHTMRLDFGTALPVGENVLLVIEYEGTINNSMAGFYRSKYKPTVEAAESVPRDEEYHYMFSTQFESSDARRAFPCFDEPNLKATFDVEIEIPDDLTALSNMPEKETKKSSKAGFKHVSFERTPIMSTYLLAWAFGDFEYVEAHTKRQYKGKNLPVRVYTTRGLKEQGRFALEHAHKVIDLFSDLFRIEYPLPKSDLLAVHEFSHGAMENWGLVTYRTVAVLFDEKKSDQRYQTRVAYVVAHELAHQWFGNLVTMDWWSEYVYGTWMFRPMTDVYNRLWLNEGFATWVGWYAVAMLHPEWSAWSRWVTEGYQDAFNLDSLRNSHAIEVPVRSSADIGEVFDAISYLKGSSVIRMLSAHLGVDTFLLGVSNYLKAHAYGNATTNDLWSAISEASNQDVNAFMDNWIKAIGFPVVTIAEEPGQITIEQKRFLNSGDVKPEEDQTTWWVPLGLKTKTQAAKFQDLALTSKTTTIRDLDETFYKLNADQTGFYRTNYPPQRLIKLVEARTQLSDQDVIGLIGDAAALAAAGEATTPALLSFVERLHAESSYFIWTQMISSIGHVRSVFADNEKISIGLRNFVLKLVTPATNKIGWEFREDEDLLTGQLRALLIATAGLAGHEVVTSVSRERFNEYFSGGNKDAIHPNLRSAIWRVALTNGSRAEYEALTDEIVSSASLDGKDLALTALGRVQTRELAEDYLNLLFSGKVASQDLHFGSAALAANPKTRLQQWQWIQAHWEQISTKLSGNLVVLNRYIKVSLNMFASADIATEIAGFFQSKDRRGYERTLGILQDTIAGNAQYKARDEGVILEWLSAHDYL